MCTSIAFLRETRRETARRTNLTPHMTAKYRRWSRRYSIVWTPASHWSHSCTVSFGPAPRGYWNYNRGIRVRICLSCIPYSLCVGNETHYRNLPFTVTLLYIDCTLSTNNLFRIFKKEEQQGINQVLLRVWIEKIIVKGRSRVQNNCRPNFS